MSHVARQTEPWDCGALCSVSSSHPGVWKAQHRHACSTSICGACSMQSTAPGPRHHFLQVRTGGGITSNMGTKERDGCCKQSAKSPPLGAYSWHRDGRGLNQDSICSIWTHGTGGRAVSSEREESTGSNKGPPQLRCCVWLMGSMHDRWFILSFLWSTMTSESLLL